MKYRFFQIIGANTQDIKQINFILNSKIFYPDFYSDPKLPDKPDAEFDYRQFFIVINPKVDGHIVVYTREELTVQEFKESIILDSHWSMYRVSTVPVINGIQENLIAKFDPNFRTIFTSYSYPKGDYRPLIVE